MEEAARLQQSEEREREVQRLMQEQREEEQARAREATKLKRQRVRRTLSIGDATNSNIHFTMSARFGTAYMVYMSHVVLVLYGMVWCTE